MSIKLNIGDIVKVDLGDGYYSFGRVLEEPLIAFYDKRVMETPPIDEIISSPILFKIWVMNHAITSGRWEVIFNKSLDDNLKQPVHFFKQDPINKQVCLYVNSEEIPATKEECEGLERAAVWNPAHVEDRLRDHYLGIPNQWVESLRLVS